MELLQGYGTDDDDDVSATSTETVAAPVVSVPAAPTTTPIQPIVQSILKSSKYQIPPPEKSTQVASNGQSNMSATQKPNGKSPSNPKKKPGKRILSLGAVLPPDIFDRLTRGPQEGSDDSSMSSVEREGGAGGDGGGKRHKRRRPVIKSDGEERGNSGASAISDRSEFDSLLNELRSTPFHVKSSKDEAGKANLGDDSSKSKGISLSRGRYEKLGMAFMTSSTTTIRKRKGADEVVDVHSKQSNEEMDVHVELEGGPENVASKLKDTSQIMSFSRKSAVAPLPNSFVRAGELQQQSHPTIEANLLSPESEKHDNENESNNNYKCNHEDTTIDDFKHNSNNPAMKSRKQKRDEERALRSGQAFQNPAATATTEIYQPSPTEFAPTAHAAAIASRSARYRGSASGGNGGGRGGLGNIAMYDPQAGTDVKGVGVTAKHKSKHQINQLMASAISLEAHRAAEAELAKFGVGNGGGKGSGSRADAKRKYGW
mmetsp:Transcript_5594/g.11447  ORF Transcript_5594/g.11447 Transcript_5594/m.11447 type:complete len:486 (+) Transcript_5594:56-1513(+)